MANNYSGRNSLVFEKTDKHRLGRIKGEWEDAMIAEIPEANERAWNQGAEEVTDGQVDSDAEVRAIGDWYRQKVAEQAGAGSTTDVNGDSWEKDQTTEVRGEAAIPFIPTGDGIQDAADYGNQTGKWFAEQFVPSLNRQAMKEGDEIGDSGKFHLKRFVGEVPELGDASAAFEHYADKIT